MSKGSHRSPAQWRSILQDYDSSTLSTNEFCRRKLILKQSLYRWRKLLESEPHQNLPLFAPIQPPADAAQKNAVVDGYCNFRIALGRWLMFELSVPLS